MKTKTKASLWMVLLTVAGFILGGIVTYFFLPPPVPHPKPPWSPPEEVNQEKADKGVASSEDDPREVEKRTKFVNMWKERLDLSDEQAEQFHQIFKAGHQKFEAEFKAARARYSQIRKETDAAIARVLTPDQAAKYKEITTEFRNRRARERENGPNSEGRDK